jgi:hypothetical protein
MKTEIIAYTAGLFDGEGSVRIRKLRKNDRKGGVCHMLVVEICNTNTEVLEWVKEHFGGLIYRNSIRSDNRHKKQCWTWTMASRKAGKFLELVMPYLKIKGKEVAVALEFQKGVTIGRPWAMTEDELIRREDCARHISALKR